MRYDGHMVESSSLTWNIDKERRNLRFKMKQKEIYNIQTRSKEVEQYFEFLSVWILHGTASCSHLIPNAVSSRKSKHYDPYKSNEISVIQTNFPFEFELARVNSIILNLKRGQLTPQDHKSKAQACANYLSYCTLHLIFFHREK